MKNILININSEPNPPNWDTNKVLIFNPEDDSQQSIIDQVLAENGGNKPRFNGQWSKSR